MKMAACPDRPVTIAFCGDTVRAKTIIGGKPSFLRRIYVETRGNQLVPRVLSVTISGNDIATGETVEETIEPR